VWIAFFSSRLIKECRTLKHAYYKDRIEADIYIYMNYAVELCVDVSWIGYIYIYVIVGHRAVELCVYVSHRVDGFICRISKPPRAGEVLPEFSARLLLEDGGP
jgi:ribonucleotide reductase beta subunit family protein with ferritin-like domain